MVPDDEVDAATADMALSLAEGAAGALGQAKRVIYQGYEHSLEEAGEIEAATIVEAMGTPDGREGIAAFAEKRSPKFG